MPSGVYDRSHLVSWSRGTNVLDDVLTIDGYIDYKINHVPDESIASELTVGYRTLERWKIKHGITRYQVNQKRYKLIQNMQAKGMDVHACARYLRITPRQCWNIIRQHGSD